MKPFAVMVAWLLALSATLAEGPDDQYVRIYNVIQEADALSNKGQSEQAVAKYVEAQSLLQRFQTANPGWNTKVVNFRLKYLAGKIPATPAAPATSPISPKAPSAEKPAPVVAPTPAAPLTATFALPPKREPAPAPLDAELTSLKDQIHQLQADKLVLEAKLKESFAAQPAAVDPRELAKAQDKIVSLQKETELLKVALAQQKSKAAPAAETKPVPQPSPALAEAQKALSSLQKENESLKTALAAEKSKPAPAADTKGLEQARQALAEAQKTSSSLQKENELLKAALAAEKSKPAPVANAKALEQAQQGLAAAQGKIRLLQQDSESLRAALAAEKSKPATAADAQAIQQAQQGFAEASRKLAEQSQKTEKLSLEKKALESKLQTLLPTEWNITALEATKAALEEANRQLAQQKALGSGIVSDKEVGASGSKSASLDAEALAALRAENQVLKKQLAQAQSAPPAAATNDDAARNLAQTQAQLAALQSEKQVLQLEKAALETRLKKASTAKSTSPTALVPGASATAALAAGRPEDAARIKQLEQERDELQKQLALASKGQSAKKGKAAAPRADETQTQLAALRAQLEVLQARPVPYSAEELAFLKQADMNLAADPKPGSKPLKDTTGGSAMLVAEARRFFAAKQFDKAEQDYLQVLQRDPKNASALANLAVIQLQLNRLNEAEKHIQQALALVPKDAFNLLVLGMLRFRQEKYNDALDALSRAATLDPQDAQVQYFLGLTLCQKGQREPGETALRKAVQLDPAYASAHHSLAIVYVTHQPPWVELARWHYQRALAAGHPHNPDLERMFDVPKTADSGK
jgi:tetratricopeptide (TPR) repeat protein